MTSIYLTAGALALCGAVGLGAVGAFDLDEFLDRSPTHFDRGAVPSTAEFRELLDGGAFDGLEQDDGRAWLDRVGMPSGGSSVTLTHPTGQTFRVIDGKVVD
ncbi:hypothetical protein [Pelagovum pacificum]|uniref:Uncharacterized protein n=1 Tax=Pelagovum pacificum TaxID=2588711 RepID=A0A5C5GCH5_9RHOB|nr:hypothetical protein [Pelagovum pacificum]QQA44389.1 hypothetical protein I8N54_07405 [Pelagovum pacificum]TNY32495.1 hypothetical protein FHY64_04175 [Pelagovum pacificum]